MLVPDKSSIYGECRRERISAPATAGLRSNRFLESARKAGVTTLDLRPVVRAASAHTDTYFLYDTHWDIRGAYASYCALLEQLRAWYPGMPPVKPISDYAIRHDPTWYSDLGRMMGLPEIHRETNVMPEMPPESLTQRKGTGMEGRAVFRGGYREGPVVALYHDSFCLWVAPFLLPHVAELRTIWSKNLVPQDFKGADVLVYAALERLIPMGKDWLRASAALMMSSQSRVPAIFHWQHTGGNDRGEGAQWGLVRTARAGRDRAGWLVFGQYHEWAPGRYEARFRLRGRGPEGAEVARVDVCGDKGHNPVAYLSITGRDLDDGRWREMVLPFEIVPGAIQPFEPRVYFNGIGELDVDWVEVQPVPNVHLTGGESA
jgi:hypothetical protein